MLSQKNIVEFKDKLLNLGPCISKTDIYQVKLIVIFLTGLCLRDNAILKPSHAVSEIGFNEALIILVRSLSNIYYNLPL